MKRKAALGIMAVGVMLACGCQLWPAGKEKFEGPHHGHMVFFTLKDNSIPAKQKLIRDCSAYLRSHRGVVYFSTGERAEAMDREVNVMDFDVSLHVIFANRQCHDDYQVSEKHQKFVERNKDNWKQVRVFDSVIQ